MLESQQPDGLIPGTAPEFPNFGGGYRDDVNWGGAFIITPYFLWQTYGDTRTMREYYAPMQAYLAYVRAQIGANGLLVSGLDDWIAGDTTTPQGGDRHLRAVRDRRPDGADGGRARQDRRRGRLPRAGDQPRRTRSTPRSSTRRRRPTGAATTGSQAMDALPLAMGIVPADAKQSVLDDLVARIDAYHPGGGGPHISGGEVSLQPIYRVLMDNGRGDVLWDVLQEPSAPSYANFVNQGRTTIPESWDFAGSQNHMILLQIDEWFSAGLAGIRQAPGSTAYDRVMIKPQAVGHAHARRAAPTSRRTARSRASGRKGANGITLDEGLRARGLDRDGLRARAAAAQSFVATRGAATPTGREAGYQVFAVEPGDVDVRAGHEHHGAVGGTVPATLSLTLGAPADVRRVHAGRRPDYTASTTAERDLHRRRRAR